MIDFEKSRMDVNHSMLSKSYPCRFIEEKKREGTGIGQYLGCIEIYDVKYAIVLWENAHMPEIVLFCFLEILRDGISWKPLR